MCIDDQILSSYIDGELGEPWRTQVEEHLDWCDACKSRYETFKAIHDKVEESVLDDSSIGYSQNRVMKYLNANVLNKPKHTWLQKLHRLISKRFLLPICTAAVTFCFCLIFFNTPNSINDLSVGAPAPILSMENIVPVRLTDNYTTTQSLENYSLEDILKYLDDSGYDVSISVKSISPIEEGKVIVNNDYEDFTLPKTLFLFNPNLLLNLSLINLP